MVVDAENMKMTDVTLARGAVRAGVGRREFTPTADETPLLEPTGMKRTEATRGTLDPLYAGALALEVDGQRTLILTADLRRQWPEWVREIRTRVAEAAGCPEDRVLFSATHDHSSSPEATEQSPAAGAALAAANRRIVDACVGAAADAVAGRRPAEVAVARLSVDEPIGQNRRVRLSNGTCVNCWHAGGICPPGHRFVGPAGPHADTVGVVAVRQPGADAPFGLLLGYATHPHLTAMPYWSGELWGGIRAAIEARVPGVTVLGAGATGGDNDLHVIHPMAPEADDASMVRWWRESQALLGRRMADAVVPHLAGLDWSGETTLGHLYWSVYESADGLRPVTIVNLLSVGRAAVVSMPGEVFNAYGERVLRESPFEATVLVGYNGSNCAYLATPLAFEQGSYEVMRGYIGEAEAELMPCGRRIMPTRLSGERLADRMVELLGRLNAQVA